jgi:large subunit ribosomal protein L25
MEVTHVIGAKERSVTGKQVKALRREGRLPAVLYGKGVDPTALELDAREATNVLHGAGASTLIDLKVGRKTYKVLMRDVQRDVIKGHLLHVDFLSVAMDEVIRTTVPVEYVGEAPAVKLIGGLLVTDLDEIEVEALPSDLPDRVRVDLSSLEDIDDAIVVGDVFLGEGVKVLTEAEAVFARVIYQVEEEEEEEIEEEILVEGEPEVIERGKREEEEAEAEPETEE